MKKRLMVLLLATVTSVSMLAGCSGATENVNTDELEDVAQTVAQDVADVADQMKEEFEDETSQMSDEEKAAEVAALIDAIYVQERTDQTDAQCEAAKKAWDALTDAQKEMVEGEEADPDYFGRDTGDASKDDPLNSDNIGENEILVVSFGTSFNDSRAKDISSIEKAIAAANPDWAVRRAFTAQIIINHVQARDNEKIDNMDQALDRAVANGVKNLLIQPTHLMHGAEYDELCEALDKYADKFESVAVAEPLLGEVGADATVINDDKKTVAQAVVDAAVKSAGFDSLDAADKDGVAFVFMGHGTAHTAKVSYSQMATQMDKLNYKNVFIGTVEGEPEETACENIIESVKAAGYKKVILRPLMVVAGDHANNDMAGDDDDSWKSMFEASGAFDSIDCQIEGLGRIEAVQKLYVEHTANALKELGSDAKKN
ncbi:MAG: sirohydrochlorin cobaltochelatase [Lachnospiraceae bacterium]|nr:sirohydrochlorin cobaltochelatase [Lachnospiraceae bacterium]